VLAPFLVSMATHSSIPFGVVMVPPPAKVGKVGVACARNVIRLSLFRPLRIPYILCMANNGNGTERGFHVFATQAAYWVGTKWAFLLALLSIVVWLVSGSYFHYSDTWQLVINTGTTVITFLVVFLIQNTQNRDARAIHLKLDEIIKSIDQAQNEMIDIEHLSDGELQNLADKYQKVREECELRNKRNDRKAN
jgi:low affinity Fe/Cu permease